MVRSILGCAAAALALVGSGAASSLVGCGGGSGRQGAATSPPGDGGVDADAAGATGESGAQEDAGALGEGGVSCLDGGAGPKGTLLVKSSTASVLGLTDDDQVIYADTTSNTLFAVAAAPGGAPASIGRTEGAVRLASKAVFNWTGVNKDQTLATALQVWTAARGVQSLAGASLVGAADSSADGSRVLYFDNASASAADLFVAGVDGSNKTKLATGIFWTQTCMPQVSFLGADAVLAYCTAAPSGMGTPVGTLAVYVNAAGTGVTVSTSASLSFQTAGTKILFNTPAGLTVADATTGASTLIDTAGTSQAAFTSDAGSVVYVANDGSIKRSAVASPSPSTLVAAASFAGLSALSPDDRWLLASKTSDPNTGDTDLYVASAATAGPAAAIVTNATATFYGSPFTADSSRVLYADDTASGAGQYHAAPTTGGPGVTIASQVWLGLATTGTKVVLQDAFVPTIGLGAQGIADIESVDVSGAEPTPTLLVNQADPGLYLTSAGDRIVYSVTTCAAPGDQGIWVMATP